MYRLESKDKEGKYYSFPLGNVPAVITIGRAKDNDITLPDPTISRHHALIRLTEDGVSVEDLDSANGIYVDGQKVDGSAALLVGCEIKIGKLCFLVNRNAPQ